MPPLSTPVSPLSTSGNNHLPNTGIANIPGEDARRLGEYQVHELCPEKIPPFMRNTKSSYQVNRSVLEWHQLPEEKWESETHSQFKFNWRPQTQKRHGDFYYRVRLPARIPHI
eukprot:417007-Prorocentrum_minimum.AAC.2